MGEDAEIEQIGLEQGGLEQEATADKQAKSSLDLRIPPSITTLLFFVLGITVGPLLIAIGVTEQPIEWMPAGIGVVMLVAGSARFGWVDISDGEISHRGPRRGRSIEVSEIRQIGLGMRRNKSTKYWFPVIETHSGNAIELISIMTPRKKKAQQRVSDIGAALTVNTVADSVEKNLLAGTNFTTPPKKAPVANEPIEEMSLTPGYDAYLREKAADEAAAAAATPAVASPVAPVHTESPQAEPALVAPAPQPIAAAPAVFQPQPAPAVFEPAPVAAPAPAVSEPAPVAAPAPAVSEPQPARVVQQLHPQPVPAQPTTMQGTQPLQAPPTSIFGNRSEQPTVHASEPEHPTQAAA